MGDQYRRAGTGQSFCCFDGVLHKLGIHAGERLVQQQRSGVTAEQRAQQCGAALLPAGKPCGGQCQLCIGKAKGAQLMRRLLHGQAVAGQHQIDCGRQLGAQAILLKNSRRRFHAGNRAGVRRFQPQQDTQQGCFSATRAPHQHRRAVHSPAKMLQHRRIAKALADILYHYAHACTSPQRRALAARSSRAARADSAADSSTITSVHAKTSGVDSVILAR